MISLKELKNMIIQHGVFLECDSTTIVIIGDENIVHGNYLVVHDPRRNQQVIEIQAPSGELLRIIKTIGITSIEHYMVKYIIDEINALSGVPQIKPFLDNILSKIHLGSIVKSIERNCGLNFVRSAAGASALIKSIGILQRWSSETYETQNICAAFGFDFSDNTTSSVDIESITTDDMMKVMSNGIDTMFLFNNIGKLVTIKSLSDVQSNAILDYTPLAFSKISNWADAKKIAVVLTQKGEILIFSSKRIIFSMRRSKWIFINPKAHQHLIGQSNAGYQDCVKKEILNTCLDISFRRTGACFGVVPDGSACPECVQLEDILDASTTPRAYFLRKIVDGKKFHELSRPIRQELAAIDGSIVLSGDGTILAAGAILNIAGSTPGRTTGGRSVAAQTLAKYGCGIKVSADGQIQAWGKPQQGTGPVVNLFTMA